jgi:sugar lactone lactonase YvrE
MSFTRFFLLVVFLGSAVFGHLAAAGAQDMSLAQILIEGQDWELVAEGFRFTEGPAADAQGNLYFTDVPESKIYKYDAASQKVSLFVSDSQRTNGLMFGPGGKLYGCRNGAQQIALFDSSGTATPLADGVPSNDLVVTRAGRVYFTDPQNQRVWRVDPSGEKTVVDEGIERPNGIILWPDEGTLVVADSLGDKLWTFRVETDGRLAFKQPYYALRTPPGQTASGADGMTVDTAGRLYVATRVGLQVFDPTGRLSGVIRKPQEKSLSNVTFAGPKFDTLYVTCTDKVYRRKTKATGVLYFAEK